MDIKIFLVTLSLLIQSLWPQIATTAQPSRPPASLAPAVAPQPAASIADSKAFIKAAQANKKLLTDLKWEFAGTSQQGFYLYVPIIDELIGKTAPVDSPEFAEALAGWQRQQGLTTSGVLDEESWKRMVGLLQDSRLKSREYPPENELVVVPATEFFDPARPDDLRKVQVQAYDAYKRMVAAARADKTIAAVLADPNNPEAKNYFKVISSWRSREYQEGLRKQQKSPLGRVGLAKFSPHFTGRALDIYVGGLPVDTNDKNRAKQVTGPVYQWLVRNAARFGFHPYFYEPWHWEYIQGSGIRIQGVKALNSDS